MSNEILNKIDGTKFIHPVTGKEVTVYLKHPKMIEVEAEIHTNHPALVRVLHDTLKEENYDFETFFGICFAYCGIVLDSSSSATGYSTEYLYEQLGRALVNKRENMAVSIDTIPSLNALLTTADDLVKAHKEKEIAETKVTTDTNISASAPSRSIH
jgi:hypothetical protein